jgi:hypothetical protein
MASEIQASRSSGAPLPATVRAFMEPRFGANFSSVRIHTTERAATLSRQVSARAFTVGNQIFFGSGQFQPDSTAGRELIAHELTHTIQQGAVVQRSAEESAPHSVPVSAHAQQGEAQRDGILDFIEDQAWSLVEKYAPELVPILRHGPEGAFEWIKDKITAAVEGMFNSLMAPVRTIAGIGSWLSGQFGPLLAWLQEAVAKIAKNDCSPLREAAEKIELAATKFITPIVAKLQDIAGKVGDFFKGIWAKFGAPVWDWIKKYAGQQWEQIEKLAGWIWDKTAPIRSLLSRAWTWLKNKIGIGDGPEGKDGILQWIQRKAEAAWDWVKAKLEPYKQQLLTVAAVLGGVLLLVSPAGPILIFGGIVVGVIQGVRWLKANWHGNLVVRARVYAEKTLIPSLMGAINRVTTAIAKMAASINGKLGELAAGMGKMVSTIAGSILRAAVAAIQWIADQVVELVTWGTEKLNAFVKWLQDGLARLQVFLQPVIEFLSKVGNLLMDVWGLPVLIAGKLWNLIPACIRDPFVDFIIPIILDQIAIFKELVKDKEAWQKTKADVFKILKLVFKDRNLLGALKAVFNLILRVFNVPVQLLVQVAQRAAAAWDIVLAAPIAFIKNCVRAIGVGFKLFGSHLKTHLEYGIEGWLFSSVADKGIKPPPSWTNIRDVFGFALDVLGLSIDHVFELLAKRFDPVKVRKLRVWVNRFSRAWDWVQENLNKSPKDVTQGLIDQAKDFGTTILKGIVTWIAQRVATEIAVLATAAAASAGLSEALDIARRIYKAIVSAVRWMRQILEMVNRVLEGIAQIAAGDLEPAAKVLEDAMHKAMPVVIGFLGDQVGLGGIGDQIRSIVDGLRAKVDTAILWLIDHIKAIIDAVVGAVSSAVNALIEWWKEKMKVGEGEEAHTLSFEGGEDDAELYLRSSLRQLEPLLAELRADAKYQKPASQNALIAAEALVPIIRADRAKARAARKAGKETEADKIAMTISTNFKQVGKYLNIVFKPDNYGDKNHAIPLKWPGPTSGQYPVLYFGGRLPVKLRPRSQKELEALFKANKKDETGNFVRKYGPQSLNQLPGGDTIGLAPAFQIRAGTVVGPLPPTSETTEGGDVLEKAIAPYGFASENESPPLQLDHVHEIQLGGSKNDTIENLWPLEKSANRNKGSKIKNADVEFPEGNMIKMSELKLIAQSRPKNKQIWFKVEATN